MTDTVERLTWATQMKLRDGSIGHDHGPCPRTGKHRVFVENGMRDGNGQITGTTWLLDDEGFARADRQQSPHDAIGPA